MASAWGNSWGAAWGNSWGMRETPVIISGGDYGASYQRKRTKRDEEDEQERREILVALADGRRVQVIKAASGAVQVVNSAGLSKRDLDAIIVAILASEL